MTSKAATVEEFLASYPDEVRTTLEALRESIRKAAPNATDGISYGVAVFKLRSKGLVGLGASKSECSFYLMSTSVPKRYARELAGYRVSGGTVHFPPGSPLPQELVDTLVAARIAEIEENAATKPQKKSR